MAGVEPIIVVLGPFAGGTSAVASVLLHLGVYMGTGFDWAYRPPHETWEDTHVSRLCRRAFREPYGQLQMDAGSLQEQFRTWADDHRRAASSAGCRPGVKQPLLCFAVDFIRDAWGPVVPVVVDRPLENVVASLNRLGWWKDEQERAEATAHLIATRDLALGDTATVRVDFEALRAAPADVIRRLADELHLKVTDPQVEAAVESIVQPADVRDADPYGRDVLLARIERNPKDGRSVSILAQIYFDTGDFSNARKWYARLTEMGGFTDEDIYFAMWRIAASMEKLDAPWPEVQDAYLRAWEFRPTRAEALYSIACRYRVDRRYRLGYLFAKRAAEIPFPEGDTMLPDTAILVWRATDEQAICASWIGKHAEAFVLFRRLLARPEISDDDRRRIAKNRDISVPAVLEAASPYPGVLVSSLVAGPRDAEVTVSLAAGPDHAATEQTLNSFLNCCTDVSRVGRFLIIYAGVSALDRAMLSERAQLRERYGFLEFVDCRPGVQLAQMRAQIQGRFWLHLGQGWRFFAPENFITRLTAVLEAEAQVFQVGINFADAVKLTGACAAEQAVRRAPGAGRYLITDVVASGPAMFDTARLDRAGVVEGTDPDPIAALGRRSAAAALQTASLDEVLSITAI
jgi:tetratricopeptide (TPR) repeat protein